ncbi:carboxypeptidase regulatory-like domain-containing protein [Pseudomonas sp. NFXW11]|uniref:carboxypeptidase regulatory-like domain-containing protein n=1 Tax=Pseudomonas sp. NFXW11 TaxID=2819531 RepID=UPI003CF5113B
MKTLSICVVSGVIATLLSVAPIRVESATLSNEPIDPAGVQLQPQQQNGISYLNGGIGLDESRAIQLVRGYNLHMTFSVGAQNLYTADVDVAIQNAQGHQLLSLSQMGPILYVQLPAGRYQLIVTRQGHEQRSMLDLQGAPRHDLNLHWAGS